MKSINDAAMQALGSYKGSGLLLFIGLGTGLGSALVQEGVVVPMELAHLSYKKGTYEDYVGVRALKRLGKKKWQAHVAFGVYHTPEVPPLPLLESAAALWMFNVFVFTLVYWEIDGGGAAVRLVTGRQPDFAFVQSGSSKALDLNWRPEFVDYLFLAFTTSTAFGPPDTLPVTSRAKVLMMLQGFVSLITIVIVAARAAGTL